MKLLPIITVLTTAATVSTEASFTSTSTLPANNTTQNLRHRSRRLDYHSHSLHNVLRKQRSLKQEASHIGNNGNGNGIGNGSVNSMRYMATVQGVKKDGTMIFMIILGDTVAAAKARGNEELILLGATPVGKGHKKRELYEEWGFTLSPDKEESNTRTVYDFTSDRSAIVKKAMELWNNVERSAFVYELDDNDNANLSASINPASACSKRGPYDTWKTLSDADLGKRKGNGIILGMCCIRGAVNDQGNLDGDVDIINNNNRDLDEWWTDSRYKLVSAHELGHMLGLAHSSERNAIMAPTHRDSITDLHCDDKAGITALYPKEQGDTVDCGDGGDECPTCSGDQVKCCAPNSCRGREDKQKCRG